jgi:hypothetical protein
MSNVKKIATPFGVATSSVTELPSKFGTSEIQYYAETIAYLRKIEDFDTLNDVLDEFGAGELTLRLVGGVVMVYDHLELTHELMVRVPDYTPVSDYVPGTDHPNMRVAETMDISTALWSAKGQKYILENKNIQVKNMLAEVIRKLAVQAVDNIHKEMMVDTCQ